MFDLGTDVGFGFSDDDALAYERGDVALISQEACVIQDWILRLRHVPVSKGGTGWIGDPELGYTLLLYLKRLDTRPNRLAFFQELKRSIKDEPRFDFEKSNCALQAWEAGKINAVVNLAFIGVDTSKNLILTFSDNGVIPLNYIVS